MSAYYTLHEHNNESIGRYMESVWDAAHAVVVLKKQGYTFARQNIHELSCGKRWSNRVIVVKHERKDSEPITPRLLKDLKADGIKAAEALLKKRKEKRKL